MTHGVPSSRSTRHAIITLVVGCAASLLCACEADRREHHGYEIETGGRWRRFDSAKVTVPGTVLEAFIGRDGESTASLVLFRSPYLPDVTASQLLVQRRHLVLNLPGLELRGAEETRVGERPAVLLEMTAPGTGTELLPTGLGKAPDEPGVLPTRRMWLTVPRGPEDGTLEVFFHCVESEWSRWSGEWDEVRRLLRA